MFYVLSEMVNNKLFFNLLLNISDKI